MIYFFTDVSLFASVSGAPTLSKLLEMPPSMPGRLPPLPVIKAEDPEVPPPVEDEPKVDFKPDDDVIASNVTDLELETDTTAESNIQKPEPVKEEPGLPDKSSEETQDDAENEERAQEDVTALQNIDEMAVSSEAPRKEAGIAIKDNETTIKIEDEEEVDEKLESAKKDAADENVDIKVEESVSEDAAKENTKEKEQPSSNDEQIQKGSAKEAVQAAPSPAAKSSKSKTPLRRGELKFPHHFQTFFLIWL